MNSPKDQKKRLMWGSFILANVFIGIPFVIVQIIGLDLLAKFMPRLANYGEWIVFVIVIPWIVLTNVLIRLGRKIGPIVMRRFYTRDEMYEILAGPLAPRPLKPRKETSLNHELEYLYK